MDMIRAYAEHVASYLPTKGREDVATEIYANICEEFEDWRSEHPEGNPADYLDETKPHPMRYATQMAEESSTWLIGPQFYFSFISALKVGASITTGFYLFLAVVVALTSGSYIKSFLGVFAGLPATLLWVSAAILGVFVAIERSGERASWLDDWSSKDLRPASTWATGMRILRATSEAAREEFTSPTTSTMSGLISWQAYSYSIIILPVITPWLPEPTPRCRSGRARPS